MYLVVLGCTRLLPRKYLVVLGCTGSSKEVLDSVKFFQQWNIFKTALRIEHV